MSDQTEVAKQETGEVTRQDRRDETAAMLPAVDIVEDEAGITLTADLPGVPKDKLTARVDGDTLLIEGELALDMPKDMEAAWAEIQVPRFRRAFNLSRDLDTSKPDAAFKDGVLKLRIAKAAHAQPHRIEIKTE
jgi:HSP20 family molecular chaperone IbpA